MNSQATLPDAGAVAPGVDLTNIDLTNVENLGNEVLSSMQSLRDLFEVRANKLEACQSTLQERCAQFAQEQEAFTCAKLEHAQSIERLEAELAEREQRCADKEQQVTAVTQAREAQAQTFQQREEQLLAEAQKAEALQRSLNENESRMAEREQRLAGRQRELQQQAASLADERKALEAREHEFKDTAAQEGAQRDEWKRRCSAIEAAENHLRRITREIQQHCQAMAEQRDVVMEACMELAAQEASLGMGPAIPQTT